MLAIFWSCAPSHHGARAGAGCVFLLPMSMLPVLSVQLDTNTSGTRNSAAFCHPLPILSTLLLIFCFHCLTDENGIAFFLAYSYHCLPLRSHIRSSNLDLLHPFCILSFVENANSLSVDKNRAFHFLKIESWL